MANGSTSNADGASESTPRPIRDRLAWTVFLSSFGGILLAALVAAGDAASGGMPKREIFSTLVPLFGTWVGTILAYYFSRENFEAANASIRKAFDQVSPDGGLQKTVIRNFMKPKQMIKGHTMEDAQKDTDVKMSVIKKLAEDGVSRIPIFKKDGSVRYIIHDATLNRYVLAAVQADPSFDVSTKTLEEFLGAKIGDDPIRVLATCFAVVPSSGTLLEAREAMTKLKGAKDVFVTKTGKPDEPVEGWITDVEIARAATIR